MREMVYEFASHLPLVTKGHILAYHSDQVNVRIHPLEAAGADWLRYARVFAVLNTEE